MPYYPHTEQDRKEMLEAIGVSSVEELYQDIPKMLFLKKPLKLNAPMSELEVKKLLTELSSKNNVNQISFLGAGAYQHFIPSIVNHILLRGEFYTAYTPYQPEISQGTLRSIFEYQTIMAELTGMALANASLYDGSTAAAEAANICVNASGRNEVIVSKTVHPEYRAVMQTYADAHGHKLMLIDPDDGVTDLEKLKAAITENTAGVIIQSPNFFGCIEDLGKIGDMAHANGALFVCIVAEMTSLGLLKPPGQYKADIVAGEGQSFGMPVSFGGPYLGVIAVSEKLMRHIPGRLAGETTDAKGRTGYVLTLQAREQHIRREKASSNICTNQGLCMLAALITLVSLGKSGLKEMAVQNAQKAHYAFSLLSKLDNFEGVFKSPFYNEFAIRCKDVDDLHYQLQKNNITPGLRLGRFYPELKDCMLFCMTEQHTRADINRLAEIMSRL